MDDCMGNYRAVVEVFVENDCETSWYISAAF